MINSTVLDITTLDPRNRHMQIFSSYDALQPGAQLMIRNDHDPKPLYYQLMDQRGNDFAWEYIEKGPESWTVKITKREPVTQLLTVGQLAAKDFRKAQVFKKYGLDFCCGGKKTLGEACREKNISAETIERELLALSDNTGGVQLNYNDWHPGFLIDFIVNNHHNYVKRSLRPLQELAVKVAGAHGSRHPELAQVASLFGDIASEMETHMKAEEAEVFPAVRKLVDIHEEESDTVQRTSVTKLLSNMESEHEVVGGKMRQIHDLTSNYHIPPGSCASYTLLLKWLKEFETDLHLHVHLENNILFRKALEV